MMESANREVSFRKPDFDDGASGSTHVGPGDKVKHDGEDTGKVESTNGHSDRKHDASGKAEGDELEQRGLGTENNDVGKQTTATRTSSSDVAQTQDSASHDRTTSNNELRQTSTLDDATKPASPTDHGNSDDLALKVKETTREAAQKVKRKIHLHRVSIDRPIKHMNPTNVRAHIRFRGHSEDQDPPDDPEKDAQLAWNARSSRVARRPASMKPELLQQKTFSRKCIQVLKNIGIMFSTFPYWDMAFWSGWSYSIGSVCSLWMVLGLGHPWSGRPLNSRASQSTGLGCCSSSERFCIRLVPLWRTLKLLMMGRLLVLR